MKIGFLSFIKRIFTNVKIFILALIITIVVVIVVKNPSLFQASVLLMQDRQTMITNQRDIWYKNSSGVLDVFISEWLKNFTDISFTVTLDPQSVVVDFSKITAQLPYEISNQTQQSFDIKLTALSGIDYHQSLFMVPFSGTNTYILLSQWNVSLQNGDFQSLAIGNLDPYKTRHQN